MKPSEADKLITHRDRLVIEHKVKVEQQLNLKIATIIAKESGKMPSCLKKVHRHKFIWMLVRNVEKTKKNLYSPKKHIHYHQQN